MNVSSCGSHNLHGCRHGVRELHNSAWYKFQPVAKPTVCISPSSAWIAVNPDRYFTLRVERRTPTGGECDVVQFPQPN